MAKEATKIIISVSLKQFWILHVARFWAHLPYNESYSSSTITNGCLNANVENILQLAELKYISDKCQWPTSIAQQSYWFRRCLNIWQIEFCNLFKCFPSVIQQHLQIVGNAHFAYSSFTPFIFHSLFSPLYLCGACLFECDNISCL